MKIAVEEIILECEKINSIIEVIDDLLEKIYPEEWQTETVNRIQSLTMVLIDQYKSLVSDIESLEIRA